VWDFEANPGYALQLLAGEAQSDRRPAARVDADWGSNAAPIHIGGRPEGDFGQPLGAQLVAAERGLVKTTAVPVLASS
jgi:hypothetical protein